MGLFSSLLGFLGLFFSSLLGVPVMVKRFYFWLLEKPQLLDLPPQVLETILLKVANRSYTDLVSCKKTCVYMKDLVQTETFFRNVDLFTMEMPWGNIKSRVTFNLACVHYENPSALFMLGAWDFFRTENMEQGLYRIKLAAERGYDLALYTYAHLTRIMFPGMVFNCSLVNLSREHVRSAKRKVKAASRSSWFNELPPLYVERVFQLNVYYGEIDSCPYQVIYGWGEPWDEWYKPEPICDSYFWKMETLAFHQELPKKISESLMLEFPEDV